jgi:hypothetical protein
MKYRLVRLQRVEASIHRIDVDALMDQQPRHLFR